MRPGKDKLTIYRYHDTVWSFELIDGAGKPIDLLTGYEAIVEVRTGDSADSELLFSPSVEILQTSQPESTAFSCITVTISAENTALIPGRRAFLAVALETPTLLVAPIVEIELTVENVAVAGRRPVVP